MGESVEFNWKDYGIYTESAVIKKFHCHVHGNTEFLSLIVEGVYNEGGRDGSDAAVCLRCMVELEPKFKLRD